MFPLFLGVILLTAYLTGLIYLMPYMETDISHDTHHLPD